jgi:hypothetical protein
LGFSFTLKINLIKTKYKVLQIAQGKENYRRTGAGSNKQRREFLGLFGTWVNLFFHLKFFQLKKKDERQIL